MEQSLIQINDESPFSGYRIRPEAIAQRQLEGLLIHAPHHVGLACDHDEGGARGGSERELESQRKPERPFGAGRLEPEGQTIGRP